MAKKLALKKRPSAAKRPSSAAKRVASKAVQKVVPKSISKPQVAVAKRIGLANKTKAVPQRKTRGRNPQGGLVYPRTFFDEVAKRAAKEAPQLLCQKVGYPLPFVGDISCSVKGFEKDLDGVNSKSYVLFEWRFRCFFKGVLIEGARFVRHRAVTVYYEKVVPMPPREIRAAACTVPASAGRASHLNTSFFSASCYTKALAYVCLPSVAHKLTYLRCGGAVPGGLCANRILAIGIPQPLEKLPVVVRDPSGGGMLLLLVELAERTFLVHPGAQRGVNGVYHYRAELVRLVTLDSVQPVQTKDRNVDFPVALANTVAPAGRHGSLKVVSALAKCMVEIYSARIARRALDFSGCLDTNPLEWPNTFWDRKLLLVWQGGVETNHASVGPDIYTVMKDCSGARSTASSERP